LQLFAFLFVFSGTGLAAELKIGIVDMQRIIEESEPGQKAMQQLKEEFKKYESEIDTKKSEVDKLRETIQNQKMMLTDEAKTDKELEFKRKVRDLQDLYQVYQKKKQDRIKELSSPILERLAAVIETYGKRHNYSFIIDKRNSGLVYGSEALEITEKVMVELNKAWRKNK
jgi:outer membrane protein